MRALPKLAGVVFCALPPLRFLFAVLLALSALGVSTGCSPSSPQAAAQLDAAADADAGSFALTDQLAAGTDLYRCMYLVPSAVDTFLVGASHVATSGMHHVLVFRTDLSSVPDAGAGSIDCYAGPSSPMQHMRGEVYGSQAPVGSFAFPPGVGLPLRGGEVLLAQVHWLDAGAKAIDVRLDLTLTTSAAGVSTPAGVFFFDDPFIDIPPGAFGQASMRCLVPGDVTLVTAASHDNARAQSVAAYLDPPTGPPAQMPFYTALDAANPLPLQVSVPVAAGSRLRFSCKYQNVNGTQEYLQGLDVQADEMCVFSGAYYPALDQEVESCALSPDEFGTGVATCADTLACVNACPAGTAPPLDLGLLSGTPNVDPCWQRCVVASCPDASALLFSLERCAQASCEAACATPSSAACAACQASACSPESIACAGDPPCGA